MLKLLYTCRDWHLFLTTHPHLLMSASFCVCVRMLGRSPPAADGRGRERQREPTSTLEVPEQQRTPNHHIRSRSVSPHREEQGRIRSRPPNIPAQRWGSPDDTRFYFKGMGIFKMIRMKSYQMKSYLLFIFPSWTVVSFAVVHFFAAYFNI